jgi:hypothetical protein
LVWFGEVERKLAKLSKTTFTYRSSSYLFYGGNSGPNGAEYRRLTVPNHSNTSQGFPNNNFGLDAMKKS